jgi:integrase
MTTTTTTLDAKTVAALDDPKRCGVIVFDSEPTLRGFAVRVRHDHSGKVRRTWIMQYRHQTDDGVIQRRQKLGEYPKMSAEQARKKARAWREKLDKGIDPAGEKEVERVAAALTFNVAVAQYLDLKRRKVRDETYRLSTLYLTDPWYFGNLHKKPLGKITRSEVSTALDTIYAESGAPTASQSQKHLSAFFVWCLKRGHAEENPVAKTEKVKAGAPRERVLSDDELRRVWLACRADDLGRVIRLLILTGCRCDEIGRLQWNEIDLDAGVIKLLGERTKNGRAHTVPITDMMREIIESIPRRVNREYLFGSRADGFTSWNVKATLGDGINEPWTLHDLRRTFRTGLGRLKIPPHIAELCINHVKKGMIAVYDKYSYEGEIAAAFVRWDEHVRAIVAGRAFSTRKVVPLRA